MGKLTVCSFWILVIVLSSFLFLAARAKKGITYDHKDLRSKRTNMMHHVERNARKKEIVPVFEDPEQTVTVTETQYVTVTVTPTSKCYLTTTEFLTRYLTTFSEAPTVTRTSTTKTMAVETVTTLKVTPTDTETTTKVLSTQATTLLQETTEIVTNATTEVAVTDTSTVALTVTTPFTVTTTIVATQTPEAYILVENARKRDAVQHRYRRVRRSWYTKIIPNVVKKWMGMEESNEALDKHQI